MLTSLELQKNYMNEYSRIGMTYPSKYVIRMFKGKYPRLNLGEDGFKGKKILDIGCGDGANLLFLNSLGLDCFGLKISKEIIDMTSKKLKELGFESKKCSS